MISSRGELVYFLFEAYLDMIRYDRKKKRIIDEIKRVVDSNANDKFSKLLSMYGYAEVLGDMSIFLEFEKALLFFEGIDFCKQTHAIKTIATSYHRLHEGGVERVLAELLRIWIKMGYKVVLFMEEPENELDFPYPDTVKRMRIPAYDDLCDRLSFLEKKCSEEQVDVFINHNWTEIRSLWECVLMKYLKIPYIQYCHGHYSWCFNYGHPFFYQPRFFKMCDLVLALSETNARFYWLCGCKTFLINNPVPSDLLKSSDISKLNSNHIVMAGRVSEEKYPFEAIQIFKMVHDKIPDIVLDIVGDGNLLQAAKKNVEDNNLGDSVFFHGKKGYEEIGAFFKQAACGLFTSKLEGYPMVILETKAYGLPMVMYDLPYLTLVEDGKGILASPVGDMDSMVNNLIKVMENLEYRKKLGNEARESFEILAKFDQESSWTTVFNCCSGLTNEYYNSFYNPDNVSELDRGYITMLLEKTNDGFDNIIDEYKNSKEYRLGTGLLKYPRMIKKLIKNIF